MDVTNPAKNELTINELPHKLHDKVFTAGDDDLIIIIIIIIIKIK